jgi:outer membrane protein OmpA-like peptidoglycan-associated protein
MALALASENKSDRAKSAVGAAKTPLHAPVRSHTLTVQQAFGNRAVLGMLQRKAAAEPGAEDEAAGPKPVPTLALQRKCACTGCGETNEEDQPLIQTKLTVNEPGDIYEREADRVADQVMRMRGNGLASGPQLQPESGHGRLQCKCACDGITGPSGECEECQNKGLSLQRKIQNAKLGTHNDFSLPPIVHEVLHSPGQPLDATTRAFIQPRFGLDFSQVRLHTDAKAAESARAVNARAYAVGTDVVFASGAFDPHRDDGLWLLAHELAHVIQGGSGALRRSVVAPGREMEELPEAGEAVPGVRPPPPRAAPVPLPETCPPPANMVCLPAASSPGVVNDTLIFPVNSATLTPIQQAEIDAAAASWRAAGGSVTVRIDGYASAEGECGYNWDLSCRRAQAVASELESPRDGSTGVPSRNVELFAHGESAEAGPALALNRKATISILVPPPPAPAPAYCSFPVHLGDGRDNCGKTADFGHFDKPPISSLSEIKLAAWADIHPPIGLRPFRSLITDLECELEMESVLVAFAGAEGYAAFRRFVAGTGGTVTHGPGSTLGTLALGSGSFALTIATVKTNIEAQLATQAASGVLNPCALSVIPPSTDFDWSGPWPLKAVIGGTHGEKLFATSFTGSIAARSYSIDLRFLICDNFGVDEHDLYGAGLIPFWVLQHERSPTLYAPFINELDLPVTVSGTF